MYDIWQQYLLLHVFYINVNTDQEPTSYLKLIRIDLIFIGEISTTGSQQRTHIHSR